jgi:hypothetical protein
MRSTPVSAIKNGHHGVEKDAAWQAFNYSLNAPPLLKRWMR